MAAGRPSKLTKAVIAKTAILAAKGLSDSQLIEVFEIAPQTLENWKKDDRFLEALSAGKENADERVVNSLYHRACGYSHPEDKIFNANGKPLVVPTIKHYPPDTAAIIFWLKNRQPLQWRDRQELTGADGAPLTASVEVIFAGSQGQNKGGVP